jgi:hypothetical protein
MSKKHDFEVLSTKLSINTTAKPVWLLNGILSMRELIQKDGEILAKSWQLDKSKTTPLSLLGLKKVVRFLEEHGNLIKAKQTPFHFWG